ncbi:MAG TPA: PTS sugar transporter subunit IIA [Verrucomicrobiota bacterium]|nr:PTS sugar transporter subunit IIA [Verrucomicrobiota bacterium]
MPYRFLNLDEAAEHLHLRRTQLERLVKDRLVPFETRGDRTVFRRQDLDDWASRHILGAAAGESARHDECSWPHACALSSDAPLLPRLIRPDQIDAAMTAKTKAAVLHDLVDMAKRTGWVCDPQELTASLQAREALCSTAVPGGVAFLHPRSQDPYRFTASFLLLGRTVCPIHYGAPDGLPTELFFMLGCQEDRLHLHTLARLCLVAQKTDVLERLRAAPDSCAMHACLLTAEETVLQKGAVR